MNAADLLPFCHASSLKMMAPWSHGDFTYASDGFVVVRVPRLPEVPEIKNPVKAHKIFEDTPEPATGFVPMPTIEEIGETTVCPKCKGDSDGGECPECDGEGNVTLETDYNSYECECKTCGGEGTGCKECNDMGYLEPTPKCVIDGSTYTTGYIRLFMEIPGARIAANIVNPRVPSWIKFDGGDALLMPIIFADGSRVSRG
jgi:hypothetical protein